jgi:predicted RNA binding protein with dsRBD fold (UPF0201 family)
VIDEIVVHVEVEVNLTEDLEKVKTAVENIFGAVKFEVKSRKWGRLLIAETSGTEGLTKLYNLLRREQIRDASRKVFFSGLTDNSLTFYLNKQVAYAGHISYSQQTSESPLGPIQVQIRCDNPRELIEWLAPRTTKRKWHSQPK